MIDVNRRTFIEGTGAALAYVATAPTVPAFAQSTTSDQHTTTVSLTVNGESHTVAVEYRTTLLDALRDKLGLTGTKKGCDRGECGACTVHIDGRRVLSCMSLAVMQNGRSITSIEGVAKGPTLHPLQAAFIEHDGFQCGYGQNAPFAGARAEAVTLADGKISVAGQSRTVELRELLVRNDIEELSAVGDYNPEAEGPKALFSFSVVFAEVRVDPELGLVRLNRVVGAYDVGRVINPKTARSQAIGGIIWGTGQALLEQSEMDPTLGRYVSRNLSGYLIPSNADIPALDVLFCGKPDAEASPIGAKGIGELTAVSVAPAIANAVFHATGRRRRELPITIEKLL
jgi:aerobic-type carbon monoxide dehydrogenase small subunit (CoxS/CutS family)